MRIFKMFMSFICGFIPNIKSYQPVTHDMIREYKKRCKEKDADIPEEVSAYIAYRESFNW